MLLNWLMSVRAWWLRSKYEKQGFWSFKLTCRLCLLAWVFCCSAFVHAQKPTSDETGASAEQSKLPAKVAPIKFAEGGKFKMLYDARQRPQAVLLAGKVFVVFNGDARSTSNEKGRAFPMLTAYDVRTREFTAPVRLAVDSSSDHHDSPIIWADRADHLHVLYGCHRTPGVHLISQSPVQASTEQIVWKRASQIAPKLSYPCVFRMANGKDLVYFRTDGHTSSWTYRVSTDNGRTWGGPSADVTDLDSGGRLDWSSYQTKIPSADRRFLHVAYTDYDDNKHDADPQRFYNPKYDALVSNEWKYNLSYLKIDSESGVVFNSEDARLRTPLNIESSKKLCEIWDTQWRGSGVPPVLALNEQGEPAFLHVLSGDSLDEHCYYYVRKVNGSWRKTAITKSSHQWNSGHLACDRSGVLHAYVVVGQEYLEGGYMDRHGGGRIEEWTSADGGETWGMRRRFSPSGARYEDWRFNNVQPVVNADGTLVHGMFIFYGWKHETKPNASAFLVDEAARTGS
ncbi:MAG: hypothetical protein CBE00_07805 [Planctomycetaceae bacterium TMED240]|nr:hypothetical protein [Rhodopirellula sp.]OUX06337.1 MAG: hypothetical protein CBE00_07805 [Planctomycetaceae bacterium TMED240]